jgi:hypothetical protein
MPAPLQKDHEERYWSHFSLFGAGQKSHETTFWNIKIAK